MVMVKNFVKVTLKVERKICHIKTRCIFQAIDIWAYGIIIWQLYATESTPYQGIALEDLEVCINNGDRPDKPANCPHFVYAIFRQCWAKAPLDRPDASRIAGQLTKYF